jgi:hypothetical protein
MVMATSKTWFLAVLPFVFYTSCTFFQPKASRLRPGLLLTFDDRHLLHWEKQIPLFHRYNAQVTFFIDHFDQLTPAQHAALRHLRQAGHAIGCHGLRHLKAAEYCAKYDVENYLSQEIVPAIRYMTEQGFSPSCFAYPSSNNTSATDRALQKYFRHLRTGGKLNGTIQDTEQAFNKIDKVKNQVCLNAISFHPKSADDDLVIQAKKSVDRIIANKEILVLYAHDIRNENEAGSGHFITPLALEEILAYAAGRGVILYSFDDLP